MVEGRRETTPNPRYDTEFCGPELDDGLVAEQARREGRWLLTRDRELAAAGPRSMMVRSKDLESQLVEVFGRLGQRPDVGLERSRCGECNGSLEPATCDEVRELVPPYVLRTADRFRRCAGCGRVYWPGTHTARITETMEGVVDRLDSGSRKSRIKS